MSQTLILVDKKNKKSGHADYWKCHSGFGIHHRGFVTLLFNSKNQVLLQKRKHIIFDGYWDLTAISHPKHVAGIDEDWQEASDEALMREMGVGHVEVKNIGAFNYFAKDGKNCENEYCVVLVGEHNGKYKANPNVVYDSKWVGFDAFLHDVKKKPKKYTPWAISASKQLKETKLESEFELMLKKFRLTFEGYSAGYFAQKIKDSSIYPKLITKFYEDLADFTKGGKRMRAFLVYLGYVIGGGRNLQKVLPISLAVEIIHSFLLIHDDVIDKSETRRGKVTIHKRYEKLFDSHYGVSQAIVLGDMAYLEAFKLVNSSEFSTDLRINCQNKLNKVLLETVYGEALDVEYSYKKPKFSDIMQIADLKTARYSFVGSLSVGGILSKCSDGQMKALLEFGLLVGLAFQLQDDYLGVFGDEMILGKSVLSDMREGKNTLLIYKTRALGTATDRKVIDRFWGKSNADIADLEKIKKIIIKTGAGNWCGGEMKRLVGRARKYIKQMTKDEKLQKVIGQMADFIVTRAS